jgi:hypothetical protein
LKRLTFPGLALSALAAITLTVTACAGGDGLVTATPLSSTGGTGADSSRNLPGEIFDSLLNGSSVGTRSGNTTFIPGKGLQFNDVNAYVTYETYYPLVNGEFSMEVEGLRPNGPGGKPKIFQIGDLRDANVTNSSSLINAQYRGAGGNPDNCIAFKAVLGPSGSVEPDLATRNADRYNLDPAKTYFWQGRWTNTSFHLVVKDGGVNGTVIYDRTLSNNGGTGFSASQMFAFLGSNDAKFNADTGTVPGMIVRNVWLSSNPRP